MVSPQELAVQQKKELTPKEEKTVPARYYVPNTDIFETDDALTLVMEIPGVEKKDVDVKLENDVLQIEGRIDFAKYESLEPVYAEYNVGHFVRTFTLSSKIDQEGISADLQDGVLTLTLRKAKQAMPRRIAVALPSRQGPECDHEVNVSWLMTSPSRRSWWRLRNSPVPAHQQRRPGVDVVKESAAPLRPLASGRPLDLVVVDIVFGTGDRQLPLRAAFAR